jgi:hypothetical protein
MFYLIQGLSLYFCNIYKQIHLFPWMIKSFVPNLQFVSQLTPSSKSRTWSVSPYFFFIFFFLFSFFLFLFYFLLYLFFFFCCAAAAPAAAGPFESGKAPESQSAVSVFVQLSSNGPLVCGTKLLTVKFNLKILRSGLTF